MSKPILTWNLNGGVVGSSVFLTVASFLLFYFRESSNRTVIWQAQIQKSHFPSKFPYEANLHSYILFLAKFSENLNSRC